MKILKQEYRKKIRLERELLSNEILLEKSLKLWKKLLNLNEIKEAKTIMSYMNFGKELRTDLLNIELKKIGKIVLLPKIEKNGELSARVDNGNYTTGVFGIKEPSGDIFTKKIDIIITPGNAFDILGNRIGYGKGYYDKFLKNHKNSLKIAPILEFQLFDTLPFEEFDEKIDIILTENNTYWIK